MDETAKTMAYRADLAWLRAIFGVDNDEVDVKNSIKKKEEKDDH